MKDNRKSVESKYTNYIAFRDGFSVSDGMLDELISMAKSRGVEFNSYGFEKDRPFLMTAIKAQIARDIWGNEGFYAVFMSSDDQVTKALSLFGEAIKLAGLK